MEAPARRNRVPQAGKVIVQASGLCAEADYDVEVWIGAAVWRDGDFKVEALYAGRHRVIRQDHVSVMVWECKRSGYVCSKRKGKGVVRKTILLPTYSSPAPSSEILISNRSVTHRLGLKLTTAPRLARTAATSV